MCRLLHLADVHLGVGADLILEAEDRSAEEGRRATEPISRNGETKLSSELDWEPDLWSQLERWLGATTG